MLRKRNKPDKVLGITQKKLRERHIKKSNMKLDEMTNDDFEAVKQLPKWKTKLVYVLLIGLGAAGLFQVGEDTLVLIEQLIEFLKK